MFSGEKYDASIIIPTYNREELLKRTLAYCAKMKTRHSFEIIVIDDGSSDNSAAVAASFSKFFPLKYAWQPDEGFRLARARNMGLSLSEGRIVIFLDCGVLPFPDFVDGHLDGVSKGFFTIGYTYGTSGDGARDARVRDLFENSNFDVDPFIKIVDIPELSDSRREPIFNACNDDLRALPAPWALAWGCNLSLERGAALAVGGYDEAYKSWGTEDVDFALSVFRNGLTFRLGRQARAIHLPHEKSFDENKRTDKDNKIYMNNKYNTPETAILLRGELLEYNLEAATRLYSFNG